ncbi:MAG: TonB-dependent receptor [Bacteroidales bacterium]|nr:TonB-dependent receptor [Bacteroidales bacterium]
MKIKFWGYFMLWLSLFAWSQELAGQEAWIITGHVTDKESGEGLKEVFVRVVAEVTTVHTYTDAKGNYTLRLPLRDLELEFSSLGYRPERIGLKYAQRKRRVDIALESLTYQIQEAVVRGEREDHRIRRPEMGLERISPKVVKTLPVLLGEPDVIKIIQLLPGVQAASEGSSGFIVRGGSSDQNLVLFDKATVYNPSHMMGFFSVFNNDAVGDVQLYKGDIPAAHGGRLSSLLDVEGREGSHELNVTGGIGLIASRLSVSGSLGQDITWLVAARRTYADLFLRLYSDTTVNGAIIHFYDLNAKMRWRVNEKNYLTLTLYNGNDRFGIRGVGFDFGNSTGSLVWNRHFSSRLSLGVSALGTMYRYDFKGIMESLESRWKASIKESGLRADVLYRWNEQSQTRFGWSGTYQWFRPGDAKIAFIVDDLKNEEKLTMSHRQAMLNTLYFSHEHKLFKDRLHLRYGLRLTRFDNVGPTKQYFINEHYEVKETRRVASGHFYHHEYGLEPRLTASYMLNPRMSVKASYSRTLQYVHLLSFSGSGSPLDVWIPTNPSIKPQAARQYSAGLFSGFKDNRWQASVELYYKDLNHVIDFKDHPNLLLYEQVETEIRSGTGYSYGAELMLKKETGDLTGWLSYTWMRSFRKINGVNNDQKYPAPSDRPHNISLVCSYSLPFYTRLEVSLNWIYATGQPFVMPEGRYMAFSEFIPVYSARNAYRMPDYHRMDFSLNYRLGRVNHTFTHDLNLSVYNLYGRKNPWMINYRLRPDGSQYAEMTYLFSVVPSITWNFSF